jgi:MoxR-like ATPase
MEPIEPLPGSVAPEEIEAAVGFTARIEDNIRRAVKVRDDVLRHVVIALLAEGHILVEDYPGVGKTALARALSRSLDCQFARVHNRASPKTQSGLLECMQERHVTVDVLSHELATPFMVFATQNPVEYEGTYPLPEAQVDRFMVRLSLGYPTPDEEAGMLAGHEGGDRVLELEPVVDHDDVLTAQDAARRVHAARALRDYIVSLLRHTRDDPRVELGASPRAGLMLLRAAKAHALVNGRDHALPDDVQALAPAVLSHRIMLVPEAAGVEREAVVAAAIDATPAL